MLNKNRLLYLRIIISLFQGVGLFKLLYIPSITNTISSHIRFSIKFSLLLFIPWILIIGIGQFAKIKNLLLYTTLIAITLSITSGYDAYTQFDIFNHELFINYSPTLILNTATILNTILAACLLVIALCIEQREKFLISYQKFYNNIALIIRKTTFTAFFTITLWIILILGANLLKLIQIDILDNLVHDRLFYTLFTTLTIAIALHFSMNRTRVIKQTQHLFILWLFPIMTLLVATFISALPFTGLAPLWKTGYASALLITTIIISFIFINIIYHNNMNNNIHPIIQISSKLSIIFAMLLECIVIYSIYLRVAQYGLTPNRVFANASVFILFIYAVGYFISAVQFNKNYPSISATNILGFGVITLTIFLLQTPVINPNKIAVNNQLTKLNSQQISVESFDFTFLRNSSGQYGQQKLQAIESNNNFALPIKHKISQIITTGYYNKSDDENSYDIRSHVLFQTSGNEKLKEQFYSANWMNIDLKSARPYCMFSNYYSHDKICHAYIGKFLPDQNNVIMIIPNHSKEQGIILAFANNKWEIKAQVVDNFSCSSMLESQMLANKFNLVEPQIKDININGTRIRLQQIDAEKQPICQK